MMNKSDEFISLYGEQAYEDIFEKFIGDANHEHIVISDIDNIDIINAVFYGFIIIDDKEIWFKAESGNNIGSAIHDFSESEDKTPKTTIQPKYIFDIIKHPNESEEKLKRMKKILDMWRKNNTHNINEMENKMNYDFYFSPTIGIKQYYENYAKKHGMKITLTSEIVNRY